MSGFISPFVVVQMPNNIENIHMNNGSFDGPFAKSAEFRQEITRVKIESCLRFGINHTDFDVAYWGSKHHLYLTLLTFMGNHFAKHSNNLRPYVLHAGPQSTEFVSISQNLKEAGRLGIETLNLALDFNIGLVGPKCSANTILCTLNYDTEWGFQFGDIEQIYDDVHSIGTPLHVHFDYSLASVIPKIKADIVTWQLDHCFGPAGVHIFGLVRKTVAKAYGMTNLVYVDPNLDAHLAWSVLMKEVPTVDFETNPLKISICNRMKGVITILTTFEHQWIHDMKNENYWVLLMRQDDIHCMPGVLSFFIVKEKQIIPHGTIQEHFQKHNILVHNCKIKMATETSDMTKRGLENVICIGLHRYSEDSVDALENAMNTLLNCRP